MLAKHDCPQIAARLRKRRAWFNRVIDPCCWDLPYLAPPMAPPSSDSNYPPEIMLQLGTLSNMGTMAAGIVHEIRNPLASLKGFLQMLRLEWQGSDRGREYINIMLEEIEGINQIASELLCLARPSQPVREACDIGLLVRDVINLLKGQALINDIDIQYVLIPAAMPLTMADTRKLKQVILNLACNAVQAMDGKGMVRIAVSYLQDADGYVVEICDNGPGIKEELLPHIFTPFFSTKGQGGGLGLHLVERIVDEHRGSIKVTSNQGQGTTFKIWLPRLMPSEQYSNH